MISPLSQENQFNTQIHNPPYNLHTAPVSGQMNQSAPQLPHSTGVSTSVPNSYNNNYTTANSIPPTSNSSFPLPSVPQNFYYEQGQQNPHLQHSTPQLPFQQVVPITNSMITEERFQLQQRSQNLYYPQHQYPQHTLPFLQPGTPAQPQQGDLQYGYSFQPQPHDQAVFQGAAQNTPQVNSVIPPYHLQHAPLMQSLSVPNLQVAGQPNGEQATEEAPFPGVLDPLYRVTPQLQPRSQTFPNIEGSKVKRVSSTSSNSSLLGMTPETARRNRCNICQKQFKRPSSLQTHLYSHTGEKPFACTWENCDRLFSVRSNMIRHRKLHERDAKLKKEDGKNKNTTALESPYEEKGIQSKNSLPGLGNQVGNPNAQTQEFQLHGW